MLTQKDFDEIEKLMDKKLDEKIKFLPSKDEFFNRMDALSGEVKAMREAFEMHAGQHEWVNDEIENHEKQIRRVEKRLSISPA